MKYFCLALAGTMLFLPRAATAGIPDGCNPATQNWTNGSGYTCPPAHSGGGGSKQKPDVRQEAPTIPPSDCATSGCGDGEVISF